MTLLDFATMRKDVADLIAGDPHTVVVRRRAKASGGAETSYTSTGRLTTAAARSGIGAASSQRGELRGEHGEAPLQWVLVIPWDTTGGLKGGDEVNVTSQTTGLAQTFIVVHAEHFSDKWEALLDSIQP